MLHKTIRLRFFLSLLLVVLFSGAAFPKFPPEMKWMEISRGKFTIVFPEGYRDQAVHCLQAAEELYTEIGEFWKSSVRERIRILIYDHMDLSDEDYTFFPYNLIKISLYPPEPHSIFGNTNDHIRDALRHGLNRIFVYNQGSRTLRFFRKYFGSNSLFFPTIYIPGWALAGFSAYEEIRSDDDTRFDSPDFSLMVKTMAAEGSLPGLDSLKSNLSGWPGPYSQYIFGAALIRHLSKTCSNEKIREFVRNYTSKPLPVGFRNLFRPRFLSMSERFREVFDRDIAEVWREIEREAEKDVSGPGAGQPLTGTGFMKKFPVVLKDGKIVFYSEDFRSYPGIYLLNEGSGVPRLLLRKKNVKSISYYDRENIIYFSAVDTFRKYYYFSDIYAYRLDTGETERLTRGARITSPVRAGNQIFCVKREGTRSFIAEFDIRSGKLEKRSGPFRFLSGLSLSPDGTRLAVSVKTAAGNWNIGVFSRDGGFIGLIGNGGSRCFSPVWKENGRLMFITAMKDRYAIVSFDMNENSSVFYDSEWISGVKHFCPAGEGKIAAAVLTGRGYEIVLADPGKGVEIPGRCRMTRDPGGEIPDKNMGDEPEDYRSFRDFTPKYFTFAFREGGNELQAGMLASGFDTLNRNYFKVKFLAGLRSGRANIYLDYIFNGLPVEMEFRYTRFTDMNRSEEKGVFFHMNEKLTSSFTLPLSVTNNGSLSLYSDIHFERTMDDLPGPGHEGKTVFNGIRLGLGLRSTEWYHHCISENDGFNFSAAYSRELEFLGSRSDSGMFSLEYTQFIRLMKINALALRFTFADSDGDGGREFYLGGISGKGESDFSGEKLFGLLRGYPSGYFRGSSGFSLNLEYRMMLKRIERSFLIFKSVESLYASFFLDAGQLWDHRIKLDPAYSAGGELNLVLYLGSYRYVLTGGLGMGFHPKQDPVFYFRLGTSF